jgi:hypothetical protein
MPSAHSRPQGLRDVSVFCGSRIEILTEGDRSRGSHVLVRELIDHLLQVRNWNLGLVLKNMVVNRASSTLNGRVGIEVEVILKGMSDILLNERTGKGVGIAVSSLAVTVLGEEADMVTLGADNNGPLDLF